MMNIQDLLTHSPWALFSAGAAWAGMKLGLNTSKKAIDSMKSDINSLNQSLNQFKLDATNRLTRIETILREGERPYENRSH